MTALDPGKAQPAERAPPQARARRSIAGDHWRKCEERTGWNVRAEDAAGIIVGRTPVRRAAPRTWSSRRWHWLGEKVIESLIRLCGISAIIFVFGIFFFVFGKARRSVRRARTW